MARSPAQLLRTARSRRGHERDTVVTVIKAITATLASYAFAQYVLGSEVAAFAPFAALFVVQSTVYRSVFHSLRYVAAVVIGVVATGAVGMTMGQTFWSLAVLVTVTVLIGRWRRFRGYGAQIPIVGLFAFAAGGGDESTYLTDLLLTVLAGALTGLIVNLLLAPPLRFRDTSQAVEDLSDGVRDLLLDMAETLRGDDPLSRADSWRRRSQELLELVDRVHAEVDFSQEAAKLNPRRLAVGTPPLASYRTVMTTLSAVVDHLDSIARALEYADRSTEDGLDSSLLRSFLPAYSDLLERLARAVHVFGEVPHGAGAGLNELLNESYELHRELSQRITNAEPSDSRMLADCGTMLLEAERMISELESLSG